MYILVKKNFLRKNTVQFCYITETYATLLHKFLRFLETFSLN